MQMTNQISNHYFVVAIGQKTKGLSARQLQEAAEDLRTLADNAVAAAFGGLPPGVLASVAPNGVMLALPDSTPTRAIRLVGALKWRLEYLLKGWEYEHVPRVSVAITNGPMRSVDVLGYRSNFEGRPAIAAARILAGLDPFRVAVDRSAWSFESLIRGATGPIRIAGKHPRESFEVMVHRWMSLEGPPVEPGPEQPPDTPAGPSEFPSPDDEPQAPVPSHRVHVEGSAQGVVVGDHAAVKEVDGGGASDASVRPRSFDVFISYASADRDTVARPLADELIQRGMSVWFDEYQVGLGDSFEQKIRDGVEASKLAVVVLSESWLGSAWAKRELDALLSREKSTGREIVVPVFHNVTREAVSQSEPQLHARSAVSSHLGAPRMADQVASALEALRLGRSWQEATWTGSEVAAHGDRAADIAIVTALPVELKMLLLALGRGSEAAPLVIGDQPYWTAELARTDNAPPRKVVVAFAGEPRGSAVASTVAQLLRDFSVPACASCGVAGALRPDVAVGDVAIGVEVADLEYLKLRTVPERDPEPAFRLPPRVRADLETLSEARFLSRLRGLSAGLPADQVPADVDPKTLTPRRHIGLIASAPHVVREPGSLPRGARVLAIDLESHAFASACAHAEPRIDWLVFRGISDVVGAKQTGAGSWLHISALAAACMLVEFLATGYRPPRGAPTG